MHKSTISHGITMTVKMAVAERDSQNTDGWPCCLYCGRPAPYEAPCSFSCAHYIRRSQGGIGCERNILTLCNDCHKKFDGNAPSDEEERQKMKSFFREYLMSKYPDWDEDNLIYKKGE